MDRKMNIKVYLEKYPSLKKRIHHLIMHPVQTRPRLWIRLLQPLYLRKSKGAVIHRNVRKDLPPFHRFRLGKYSVVENYSCLNNAAGDILIGDRCRIGLGNTVIGPVWIDNGVNIAQHVVLVGMRHNYQDITRGIIEQGITIAPVHIGEHTIIGANAVILPGVTIGRHCFIGAGSIVTGNIPDYSVTAGNPARIIKSYNRKLQTWEKTSK